MNIYVISVDNTDTYFDGKELCRVREGSAQGVEAINLCLTGVLLFCDSSA